MNSKIILTQDYNSMNNAHAKTVHQHPMQSSFESSLFSRHQTTSDIYKSRMQYERARKKQDAKRWQKQ